MSRDVVLKQKIVEKKAELNNIHKLKETVAQRVWDKAVPVITKEAIEARTELLAATIKEDYKDTNPVLVLVADGALPFANLLQKELNKLEFQYTATVIQASSYRNEMTSGELTIGFEQKVSLAARKVLVVDDVCDTGKTYLTIAQKFKACQAAESVAMVALVNKSQKRIDNYEPEYFGFELSKDAFIVGMGLDYLGGTLRNTSEIRRVTEVATAEEKEIIDSEKACGEELQALYKELQALYDVASKPGKNPHHLFNKGLQNSVLKQPLSSNSVLVEQSSSGAYTVW